MSYCSPQVRSEKHVPMWKQILPFLVTLPIIFFCIMVVIITSLALMLGKTFAGMLASHLPCWPTHSASDAPA